MPIGVVLALSADYPIYRLFKPTMLANRVREGFLGLSLVVALAAVGSKCSGGVEPSAGVIVLVSAVLVFTASCGKGYVAVADWLLLLNRTASFGSKGAQVEGATP